MARKRNHPLVELVVWLGVALTCTVLLLAIAVSKLPAADVLEHTFLDGMEQGSAMCLDLEQQFNPGAAPKPAALAPNSTAKGGLI